MHKATVQMMDPKGMRLSDGIERFHVNHPPWELFFRDRGSLCASPEARDRFFFRAS